MAGASGERLPAQVLRFGLVGAVVFLGDLLLFLTLLHLGGAHYLLANTAGKLGGAALGFVLHRTYTFRWRQTDHWWVQLVGYLTLLGVNIALANALLAATVDWLLLPPTIGKLLSDGVVIVVSFVASRSLVFRRA